MWLLWGAVLSAIQCVLYCPAQLVQLLMGCLRCLGGFCFSVSNEDEQHPQLRWLEWYLQQYGWTMGRKAKIMDGTSSLSYRTDLRRMYGQKVYHECANLVLGSGLFFLWCGGPILGVAIDEPSQSLPWSTQRYVPRTLWIACISQASAERFLRLAQDGYEEHAHPLGQLRFFQAVCTPQWSWWESAYHPPVDARQLVQTTVMGQFREAVRDFFGGSRPAWSAGTAKRKLVCLLHGPPGGGKTQVVKTAAAENGVMLYDLSVGGGNVDDFSLQRLQHDINLGPKILMIDEFDSAASDRGRALYQQQHSEGDAAHSGHSGHAAFRRPSKAGWHKLLDCEGMSEVVVVLLTNRSRAELEHIFGAAFLRSMRIDRSFHFGVPDRTFLRQICRDHHIDPPLEEAPDSATVADVASVVGTVDTALQLRRCLSDAVSKRQVESVHGKSEALCRQLGLSTDRYLLPLTQEQVTEVGTLLALSTEQLASTLQLTTGMAYELDAALTRYEERPMEQEETLPDLACRSQGASLYTSLRLRRALQRQGDLAHLFDDPRIKPADRIYLPPH